MATETIEPNQQIQNILGDFNATVKEFTREAADGLIRNGFKGMEQSLRDCLNSLYIRGREVLTKPK